LRGAVEGWAAIPASPHRSAPCAVMRRQPSHKPRLRHKHRPAHPTACRTIDRPDRMISGRYAHPPSRCPADNDHLERAFDAEPDNHIRRRQHPQIMRKLVRATVQFAVRQRAVFIDNATASGVFAACSRTAHAGTCPSDTPPEVSFHSTTRR